MLTVETAEQPEYLATVGNQERDASIRSIKQFSPLKP